jgi:hypothetical protein
LSSAFDNSRLVSFVCIAVAFERGESLDETSLYLVEDVLINLWKGQPLPFQTVIDAVNEIYKVKMYKATLDHLLKKMRLAEKVSYKKGIIKVLKPLHNEILLSEQESIHQDNATLFAEFQTFLSNKDIDVSADEAKDIICEFIFTHSHELADFFNGSCSRFIDSSSADKYAIELGEFLIDCKIRNSVSYSATQRIYKGAVQASMLNLPHEKVQGINTENDSLPFDNLIIDTNFAMRILGIQAKLECMAAKETFTTLKEQGSSFYILKETLVEISTVINHFLNETAAYSTHHSGITKNVKIRPSGLLAATYNGVTRADLMLLTNLETLSTRLKDEHGIILIPSHERFKFRSVDKESLILSKTQQRSYSSYGVPQAEHDLTLIEYCKKERNKTFGTFASARWWVLTNDAVLTFWNQQKGKGIQECITEAQISNILWINRKKAESSGLVNAIITVSSRSQTTHMELNKFIERIGYYLAAYKDNPEKCDKVALMIAAGGVTDADVRSVCSDEVEIDELINQKMEQFEREKMQVETTIQGKDAELEKRQDELHEKNIELELKNRELEQNKSELEHARIGKRIAELLLEKSNLVNQQRTFRTDKQKVEKAYSLLKNIKEYHDKNAGRKLGLIWLLSSIVFYATAFLTIKRITPCIITFLDGTSTGLVAAIQILFSFIVVLIINTIALPITAAIFRQPMNVKDLFEHAKEKSVIRYAKKRGVDLSQTTLIDEMALEQSDFERLNIGISITKKEVSRIDDEMMQLNAKLPQDSC